MASTNDYAGRSHLYRQRMAVRLLVERSTYQLKTSPSLTARVARLAPHRVKKLLQWSALSAALFSDVLLLLLLLVNSPNCVSIPLVPYPNSRSLAGGTCVSARWWRRVKTRCSF